MCEQMLLTVSQGDSGRPPQVGAIREIRFAPIGDVRHSLRGVHERQGSDALAGASRARSARSVFADLNKYAATHALRRAAHDPPRLITDDFLFVREALRAGGGIGFLPTFLAQADVKAGQLVRVLPRVHRIDGSLTLLYAKAKQVPARVTAFRDFLVDTFARPPAQSAPVAGP